jgi:protein-S-isoprenylcysteine O-methyltransferase Ste14
VRLNPELRIFGEGLVKDSIYRYIRHPQYTGLFLIMFGWLLHWPAVLTLIIFPILVLVYYRLAVNEETALAKSYGKEFKIYRRQTPTSSRAYLI